MRRRGSRLQASTQRRIARRGRRHRRGEEGGADGRRASRRGREAAPAPTRLMGGLGSHPAQRPHTAHLQNRTSRIKRGRVRHTRSCSRRSPRTRRRKEASPRTRSGLRRPAEDVLGKLSQPRAAHVLKAAAKRGVCRSPRAGDRSAEISKGALTAQRLAGGSGRDVDDEGDIRAPPRKEREGVRPIRPTADARPHRTEGTCGRPVAGKAPPGASLVADSALEHQPARQKRSRLVSHPRERHGRNSRVGGHRDAGVVRREDPGITDEGVH